MNAELALNLIPPAIEKREMSKKNKWVLIWEGGMPVCVPYENANTHQFLIFIITEDHIANGLTLLEWARIKLKISDILERKVK